MHFRNKGKSRSKYLFKVKGNVLEYTDTYKYLGIFINEFLDFSYTADTLAQAEAAHLVLSYKKYTVKRILVLKLIKSYTSRALYLSLIIALLVGGLRNIKNRSQSKMDVFNISLTFINLLLYYVFPAI